MQHRVSASASRPEGAHSDTPPARMRQVGWDKRVWDGRRILHPEGQAVQLTYTSSDGEEVRRTAEPAQQGLRASRALRLSPRPAPAEVVNKPCSVVSLRKAVHTQHIVTLC